VCSSDLKDNSYINFKNNYSVEYLNKLLILSKKAILEEMKYNKYTHFIDIDYYNFNRGVFLRIKKNGRERGCIGFFTGVKYPEEAVRIAAIDAAFFDHRFPPLTFDELKHIELEVTIIDRLVEIKNPSDFKIGIHSLMIENYSFRGFLQAQIATEEKYTKKEFLKALCKKAGLGLDQYKNKKNKIYRANTIYYKKKFNDIEM